MLVRRAGCEGEEKIIGRRKRDKEFEGIIGAGGFLEGCMYVCMYVLKGYGAGSRGKDDGMERNTEFEIRGHSDRSC